MRRESNRDCDRLSHPEMALEVIAEAEREGLEVRRLRMSEDSPRWEPIRSAIRAVAPARRARRHRLLETAEPLQPPPPFQPESLQILVSSIGRQATGTCCYTYILIHIYIYVHLYICTYVCM